MDDTQLLELAYKAFMNGALLHEDKDMLKRWNPLVSDADALRLAVKLQMHMIIGEYIVYVRWMGCSKEIVERATMGYSIEEATRRAIVRAAAEIGKTL